MAWPVLHAARRLLMDALLQDLRYAVRRLRAVPGAPLFQTDPRDPWLFATAAVLLGAIALLATWLPARRAAALDPVEGLAQG